MNLIKVVIKKWIYQLGYVIQKKPDAQSDLKQFERDNWWLKDLGISTILDIGANEGQFALRISYLLPAARLHCFEPLPKAFEKLKENLQTHPAVKFYPFALGDSESEMNINLNESSPSSSFLPLGDAHQKNFSHAIKTVQQAVIIKRLDDLEINIKAPLLIKMDVQGFEDKVINGGIITLRKALMVIIETSFEELYDQQPLFHEIYEMMHTLGFSYNGNMDQLGSPVNGRLLQSDAIFINRAVIN